MLRKRGIQKQTLRIFLLYYFNHFNSFADTIHSPLERRSSSIRRHTAENLDENTKDVSFWSTFIAFVNMRVLR